MARIEIRHDRLKELCAAAPDDLINRRGGGINQEALAQRIGVAPSTVFRCLDGQVTPGKKFIAGLLRAFPGETFPDLFRVVDDAAA